MDAYYEIDLGDVYEVSAYQMYFYRHPTYGLPETWVVFLSQDGQSWTRMGSYQKTVTSTLDVGSNELYKFDNPINARYFRLSPTRVQAKYNSYSGVYWDRPCVNEIEVLAVAPSNLVAVAPATAAQTADNGMLFTVSMLLISASAAVAVTVLKKSKSR